MSARALVIAFSRVASDPRVMRQVRALSARFELTVAGFGAAPAGVRDFVSLPEERGGLSRDKIARLALLALRRFDACYRALPQVVHALAALRGRRFDVVVCNDVHALPLAIELSRTGGLMLDAHEFSPREFEERVLWRALHGPYADYLCRTYMHRAHAFTTVAPGIAGQYRASYGVEASVVYSAPPKARLQPAEINAERVRIVHHGAAMPERRIERIIEAVSLLDSRYTLDLMLVPGDPAYLAWLARRAGAQPRIRMLPPVPMEEIVAFTNQFDVGLYMLPPTSFNSANALPNKFFEFIQARLAVAIGPSPEMRRLVEKHDCGVVAEDFTPRAMARTLSALTPGRLAELKANACRAADELCWERQEPVFLAAVERALAAAR